MDDDFGADDDLLAALAASTSGPGAASAGSSSSGPQAQSKGRIQQPTPQRLDRAAPPPSAPLPGSSNNKSVVQPTPQALPTRSSGSSILVSPRQKGNPVLACLRSLPWEYSDIPADYGLGLTTCALFLSLKYHRLHPEYIYTRIRNLQGRYNLRVLLTMVDITNHEDALRELAKTSLVNNVTVMLCWSAAEAARYLELYKSYEHVTDFAAIRAQQATSYAERLVGFVTVPRAVHRADAVALVSAFGSLRAAVNAPPEQVAAVSGWGERKVRAWCRAVEEPFRIGGRGGEREGETTAEGEEGEEQGRDGAAVSAARASRPTVSVLDEAIPIGRVPLRDMPPKSTVSQSSAKTGQTSGGGGGGGDGGAAGDQAQAGYRPEFAADDDEEDAMIAAAVEASKRTASQTRAGEEQLSSGITAALAKLREKG